VSKATKGELIDGVEVTITPNEVGEDPSIVIFHVSIEDTREGDQGIWTDTFGSKDLLNAYLRGIEAGAVMIGRKRVLRPEIPFTEV